MQTIELDCAPGTPRPDTVLKDVLKGLDFPERQPVSAFFGCWTWDYSDIPEAKWKENLATIKERISEAYSDGRIRYGSWS